MNPVSPLLIEIDDEAIASNIRFLQTKVSPSRLCVVLKAGAYGHGCQRVARIASDLGVTCLGFCDNSEAASIRELGITCQLIRLRPATLNEIEQALLWNIEECIGGLEDLEILVNWARTVGKRIPVHLELDVGIGRSAMYFEREYTRFQEVFPGSEEYIDLRGVFAHSPSTDGYSGNHLQSLQLTRFQEFVETLKADGIVPKETDIHFANSAYALRYGGVGTLVRTGLAVYGASPFPEGKRGLQMAMRVSTSIVSLRHVSSGNTVGYNQLWFSNNDRVIATLPIGYAYGYLRGLKDAEVLVSGLRAPVVGAISMNMITVDVTDIAEFVTRESEVVLLGPQGDSCISADEFASWMGTISYEVFTLFGNLNKTTM